jgi:hypothetical protein
MTYQDKFVAEVKVNGRILRIKDGAVYLPFGSEYTLYLKNLNSKRASVNISIDGEDVLDNNSLILDANSSTELQGFLRGNVARNRFRFINKTKQIADHRGDKADDGLIRVEFAYEKPQPEPWIKKTIEEVHYYHHYHHNEPIRWTYHNTPDWNICRNISSGGDNVKYGSSDASGPADQSAFTMSTNVVDESKMSNVTMDSLGVAASAPVPNADEGITVKGSEVHQSFMYSSIGELEDSTVIIINLKGLIGQTNKPIQQAVTVKTKVECPTCGTKSTSAVKYCANCGTFLE